MVVSCGTLRALAHSGCGACRACGYVVAAAYSGCFAEIN